MKPDFDLAFCETKGVSYLNSSPKIREGIEISKSWKLMELRKRDESQFANFCTALSLFVEGRVKEKG